jgi:putative nucleotidyltransferase with HDIG domain
LSSEKGGITGVFPFLGKIIFSGSILLLLGYLIFNLKPEIATNRNFFLILVILSAHLAFLQLILATAEVSAVLFPAALAAMLITIFYGHYIGFVFLGALALFAGALQGNDFQLTLLTLVVGSVAIISVKRIRSRTQILTSSIYLAITYIVFLTGYHFIIYSFSLELLRQIGIAVLNSILTSIFALGLAIILGNLFGITTELTLLELSDLNRPLLKRLSAIAPGTYHHSLEVGMMAEAAAEAVNANPLLARAGAYYHDIGKMEKRDYFIENQFVTNPHDALTPEASADILNSHIDEGLIIAEHNHLPRMIKDIITQHHGTSIMQYFYHKALKITEDSVDRERFKYKGPLPNSKESGIIMLADAVEAAVRSLGKSSVEEVKVKVRNIILEKFQEGQLDYCELSVRDLQTVEDSFVATLTAHAHHRIEYPSREEIEEEEIARARTNNI